MFSFLSSKPSAKPTIPPKADPLFEAIGQMGDGGQKTSPPKIDTRVFPPHELPRSELEGFFSALGEAVERFDMMHVAPLAQLDPGVRFQLRNIIVEASVDNDKVLREIQALAPGILKKAAVSRLKQSPVAANFDLSNFYGVIISAGDDLAGGEAVMTLATIGVERFNVRFGFQGEHVNPVQGSEIPEGNSEEADAHGEPVSGTPVSLTLRHPDGRTEFLEASRFPLVIGSSAAANIRLSAKQVSREHATLFYDKDLQRVMLQDHSSNGTWMNGRPLGRHGQAVLAGAGTIAFSASPEADVPVIEFSYAGLSPMESTPLVVDSSFWPATEAFPPAKQVEAASVRVTPPVFPAEAAMPVLEPVSAPQVAGSIEAVSPASPAADFLPGRAETCLLNENPVPPVSENTGSATLMAPSAQRALGYAQIRTQDGVETVPITAFPFVIGREPGGNGYAVPAEASCVSRAHLSVESLQHGHFNIRNLALGRSNTFRKGVIQDSNFLYRAQCADNENGWLVLGGRTPDAKAVEVRFLSNRQGVLQ